MNAKKKGGKCKERGADARKGYYQSKTSGAPYSIFKM